MTAEVRGAQVWYERLGQGAPLLLLHGWGVDHESFLPIARDFADRREIIQIDFPGHGNSPEPPEPWTVNDYAEMTAELIEKLGIRGADIIAHSFGGRVSIVLAATRPELVGKLILAGCAGIPPRKGGGKETLKSRAYRLLRALSDNALTRALLGERRVEGLRNALRQKFGSADYRALKTDRMRATFNKVIAQDLSEYLPGIKAPTLLVFGDEDTATPLWMGQEMERLIPDAGLVTFEGAGHYPFLDQFQRFQAIARSFLKI